MMKLEKECLLIIRTSGFDVGFVWGVEWGGFRETGVKESLRPCAAKGVHN